MEPNIPVGSEKGIAESMQKALAGAVREQQAGASGKWVAHYRQQHLNPQIFLAMMIFYT